MRRILARNAKNRQIKSAPNLFFFPLRKIGQLSKILVNRTIFVFYIINRSYFLKFIKNSLPRRAKLNLAQFIFFFLCPKFKFFRSAPY